MIDGDHSKERALKSLSSMGTNGAAATSTQTGVLYIHLNAAR